MFSFGIPQVCLKADRSSWRTFPLHSPLSLNSSNLTGSDIIITIGYCPMNRDRKMKIESLQRSPVLPESASMVLAEYC
jgi:hypothetical protein